MSPRIKPESAKLPMVEAKRLRLRPWAWTALLLIIGAGIGVHFVWQYAGPRIGSGERYLITADHIHITPPPPWIRSDIKSQVLSDIGVAQHLSLLDDWQTLVDRVTAAFEFHPWVASVERITRSLPSSLTIELAYRRPIAAVESSDSGGIAYLPIDEHAIRLPDGDFTDAERRHLPRISGATGRPLVGDAWDDPRVEGGARLAAALADVWQPLQLVEILTVVDRPAKNGKPQCTFEIVTAGGTRIMWGVAPGAEAAAGELPCDQKVAHLVRFVRQRGGLDSIDGPATIDVRRELIVIPHTARHRAKTSAAEATQAK